MKPAGVKLVEASWGKTEKRETRERQERDKRETTEREREREGE